MKISKENQRHDCKGTPQGTGKTLFQVPLFQLLNLTQTVPGSNQGSAVCTWRIADKSRYGLVRTNRCMLYVETTVLYCENHVVHIHKLR
jgi:hypothetical protein